MPPYLTNPSGNSFPIFLAPGNLAYVWGTKGLGQNTLLQITKVAITGNVATVTVLVREGNIPVVNALITITGTATLAGLFNVTNVAITGVSIAALTGIGTITFALTHADVAAVADAGQGYVPPLDVGETPTAPASSIQCALAEGSGGTGGPGGTPISFDGKFSGAPGGFEVDCQAAQIDADANYQTVASGNITAVDATNNTFHFVANVENARFVRMKILSRTNAVSFIGTIKR
jgi:hypothetical protein